MTPFTQDLYNLLVKNRFAGVPPRREQQIRTAAKANDQRTLNELLPAAITSMMLTRPRR